MNFGHSLPFKAVIWDLDGTLYQQAPLRRRMLWELSKASLGQSPAKTARMFRWLKTFREVREELRSLGQAEGSLESIQFAEPAQRLGVPAEPLEKLVRQWMWQKPLPFLKGALRQDVVPVLEELKGRGIPMGVFSDYPVKEKLQALGLDGYFSVQMAATDPEINAFKPHPRGFQAAAEALGVPDANCLFVGDRMDVDGMGAQAAGQQFRILDQTGDSPQHIRHYGEFANSFHV